MCRVWVLDAANPILLFIFDKSYVIALQMYLRKAAYKTTQICAVPPPKGSSLLSGLNSAH